MGANYEVKIIERLASSEICTNKQLALLCDCSQRTIQNKLKEINGSLYSFGYKSSICSIKGKGSYLNIYDGESIDDILELFKEDDDYGDRDDIAREIAVELLISDYLKIESICDKYCLSRSAVVIILNFSKRLLGEFDIDVLSKPHYGLFVKGCENKIRKFLLDNYSCLPCDDNERLEDYIVWTRMRDNMKTKFKDDFDIVGRNVRCLNESSKFDKVKTKLLPGMWQVVGTDGGLFVCKQDDYSIKLPRWMLKLV